MHLNDVGLCISNVDIEPQYKFDVECNTLWLDTIYWTFQADLKEMDVGHEIFSKHIKIAYLLERFYLHIMKSSHDALVVGLNREVGYEEPENDYTLQLSYTFVSSTASRKIIFMTSEMDHAPVQFFLDEIYTIGNTNDMWLIKCVVWMKETANLNSLCKNETENIVQKQLGEIATKYYKYEEMASMTGHESFKNFPFGRQDSEFAKIKSTLLQRSLRYSDKIVSRIVAYQNFKELNVTSNDLGNLLGFICTGRECRINRKSCVLLYAGAFYCGLSYLKLQCSDFIKMNLNNVGFLINVLVVADLLDDLELQDYAMDWFIKNKKRVLESVRWKNFKNRNYKLATDFLLQLMEKEHDLPGIPVLEPLCSLIRVV